MSHRMQYDKSALEYAVDAVKSKSMGYLKASRVFNVPRSTIFDKVKEKSEMHSRRGPHTVLTFEEEKRLANWLIEMSRIGYGRSKQELLDMVQKIIREDGRETRFKNHRPGKDWYYGFMKRHPEISLRSPRQLQKERAVIQPKHIEKWFDDFQAFILKETNDPNILKDPTRIYNADESGFSMSAKTGHVLGPRGTKSVFNLTASDKSQITVLMGMSASAHFLRPLIVFPGQRFTRNMLEGFEDAVLGRSENGWMDSELFVSWLQTVFIPDIEERQVKRPVILLVDGHKTHVTLEASDICKANGIVLYCLLEHASHLIQPCDLRLFASLKESWKIALREWQVEHIGEYATKYEFAAIFRKAWMAVCKVENAVNAFRDAGLFPLNPEVVLCTDKFQTCKLFKKTHEKTEACETAKQEIEGKLDNSSEAMDKGENQDVESDMITAPLNMNGNEIETHTAQDNDDHETDQTKDTGHGETLVAVIVEPEEAQNIEQKTGNPTTNEDLEDTESDKDKDKNATDPAESKSLDTAKTEEKNRAENSDKKTESPMTKYLKIPEVKPKNKKFVKRDILPKAVTGEEFRKILLERKRKREEENEAKKMRKLEREKRKLEKEKVKQEKQQQRLQKKKEREEEKAIKASNKRLKELLKQKQKKSKDTSDSESDCSMKDVNDDSDDDITDKYDANVCYKCNEKDNMMSGWIGCQNCYRFFHRNCTDIDFSDMTGDEIAEFPFECLYC